MRELWATHIHGRGGRALRADVSWVFELLRAARCSPLLRWWWSRLLHRLRRDGCLGLRAAAQGRRGDRAAAGCAPMLAALGDSRCS